MEFLNTLKMKMGLRLTSGMGVSEGVVNKKAISNILSLFFIRGGNILIQLLTVPLSIRFISAPSYGLWLTISAIIAWLNLMDIGLLTGLRNMLTIAIVNNDMTLAKK